MKSLSQSLNESFMFDSNLHPIWYKVSNAYVNISDFDCNVLIDILSVAEKYYGIITSRKSSISVPLQRVFEYVKEHCKKYSNLTNKQDIPISLIAAWLDYYAKYKYDIEFVADTCPYLGEKYLFINNQITVFVDSRAYDKPVGCVIYNTQRLCNNYIYLDKTDDMSVRKQFESVFGNNAYYINTIIRN